MQVAARHVDVADGDAFLSASRMLFGPITQRFARGAAPSIPELVSVRLGVCRLSEIRYSINDDTLDKRFPLAACDPELPFNLPSDDTQNWLYLGLKPGEAKTVAVQAVWDDGSGSEIVVYQPCRNPEATCAAIRTIKKSKKRADEPSPSTPAR